MNPSTDTTQKTASFEQHLATHLPQIYRHTLRMGFAHEEALGLLENIYRNMWGNMAFFAQQEDITLWIYRYAFLEIQAYATQHPDSTGKTGVQTLSPKEQWLIYLTSIEKFGIEQVAEILLIKPKVCKELYESTTQSLQREQWVLADTTTGGFTKEEIEDWRKALHTSLPPQIPQTFSLWQRIKPWVYMLAMFAGIMLMIAMMKECSTTVK